MFAPSGIETPLVSISLYQIDRVANKATQVCGVPLSGDVGFGDQDRSFGLVAGNVIEYIAVGTENIGANTIVSSMGIKYRNEFVQQHGQVRSKEVYRRFNLAKKEAISSITITCGGPANNEHIQSLAIVTTLNDKITFGKVNPAKLYTFAIAGKQVVSFRGYTGRDNRLKTLGLQWANQGYGKW